MATPARNELEDLQYKTRKVTDDTLEATRRMMQHCAEGQEAGAKGLVLLEEQGEQLDRTEKDMDQINEDMRAAEKNLKDLEKCCGCCLCPWKKRKAFDRRDAYKVALKPGEDGKAAPSNGPPRRGVDIGNRAASGVYIQRITNDAAEDEMEENLAAVDDAVGNMKNMAIDMGNKIDSQNTHIDRIRSKGDVTNDRVDEGLKRTRKLLYQ